MGEMLFDNQLNEEINCSGSSIKELSKCNDSYVDNQEPMVQYDPNVHIGLNSSYVAFQTFIPVHHTSDVLVPPPNKLFV